MNFAMSNTRSEAPEAVRCRANIRAMVGYVPGEQPRDGDWIKLNTNENPYPPSPKVLEAIAQALTGDRLRKYPDPLGTSFRRTAAKLFGVDPEAILIGNGSDDILTIATRTFVPENGMVAAFTPSYILYCSLAEIQGARFQAVPFGPNWSLGSPEPFQNAHLTFIPNPNSPSGTMIPLGDLAAWIDALDRPVVIDEAYGDFAPESAVSLIDRRHVVVTRSLSKSYSLAGIRFGFALADPAVIREMLKVKDSYNCDALSLVAAEAALLDQEYLQSTRSKIISTRQRLQEKLCQLGYEVTPSYANFVWCRRTDRDVRAIYEMLKQRKILVRYMNFPGYGDGLRISVGSDHEIDRLLEELRAIG
jgi:histidinol-phosphate aminotransferase